MKRFLPALLALTIPLALPAPAGAEVEWLCRPGLAGDPCEIPLDTTVQEPGGGSRVETLPRPPQSRRTVDCFYVYPTVSNQLSANADKSRDPELVSIAKYQAARFSSQCRVFAPIYRQGTLAGIATGNAVEQPQVRRIAYSDVAEAWRAYIARDNGGRGVVLIGHSQGTRMLRALIRREIDPSPDLRRRFVGGLLLGGNVTVARGRTTGGEFRNVPVCTRRGQTGCVTAFSTYAEDPAPNSRYGRTTEGDEALGLPGGAGYEVACTDPGALSGITGPFAITVPSEPFAPGPIAAGNAVTSGGMQPTAPTTWVTAPDRYQGSCRTINGANVLRYDPLPGSRRPNPFPEPGWGTHLIDVNLGLERQVAIVSAQADRWVRARGGSTAAAPRRCAASRRIRVRVRPRRAVRGRPTRFRIRAFRRVNRRAVAVKRARVRFAGRTLRTKRRGRVARRLTLRRTGRRRVSVTRAGLCRGRAVVRVRAR